MSTKYTTAPKHRCAGSAYRPRPTRHSSTPLHRPSPERILAFIEGSPVPEGIDDVIGCIVSDAGCRDAISFVVSAAAECKAAERASMVWRRLASIMARRTRIAKMVESDGIDAIAAESGENVLVFKSGRGTTPSLAWRAEIVLPPMDTFDAPLEVRVSDKSGRNAEAGTFTICGIGTKIVDGRGKLDREALVSALATGGVSFAREGKPPVEGNPVFGSLE